MDMVSVRPVKIDDPGEVSEEEAREEAQAASTQPVPRASDETTNKPAAQPIFRRSRGRSRTRRGTSWEARTDQCLDDGSARRSGDA